MNINFLYNSVFFTFFFIPQFLHYEKLKLIYLEKKFDMNSASILVKYDLGNSIDLLILITLISF